MLPMRSVLKREDEQCAAVRTTRGAITIPLGTQGYVRKSALICTLISVRHLPASISCGEEGIFSVAGKTSTDNAKLRVVIECIECLLLVEITTT